MYSIKPGRGPSLMGGIVLIVFAAFGLSARKKTDAAPGNTGDARRFQGDFCPFCGAKVEPAFDFCPKCGKDI